MEEIKEKENITKKPSIKRNMIVSFLYQIVVLLAPLVTAPYLSRVLGAGPIGQYSFDYSLVNYFIVAAQLGISEYGTLEIAKVRDDKEKRSLVFWSIFFIKLISTILFSGVYFSLAGTKVLFDTTNPLIYYILGIDIIAVGFDPTFYFYGIESFSILSFCNLFNKLLNISLIFIFVKTENDLLIYSAIMVATNFLFFFILFFAVLFKVGKVPFSSINSKAYLKGCFLYILPSIASTLYYIVDKTIIGFLVKDGGVANGFYEQANKLVKLVVLAIDSLNTVMRSRMCFLINDKNSSLQEKKDKERKMFNLAAVLSFASFFGITSICQFFVPLFFGSSFTDAIPYVYILSSLVLIMPFSNLLESIYYIPKDKIYQRLAYLLAGGLTNVALDFITVIYFGPIGACYATVISEFIYLVLLAFGSRKDVSLKNDLQTFLKPFIASLAMFLCCFFLLKYLETTDLASWVSLLITVLLGATIYFLLLIVLKDSFVISGCTWLKNYLSKRRHKENAN
jgi:O-antigen/teichoic acid export membrane protein